MPGSLEESPAKDLTTVYPETCKPSTATSGMGEAALYYGRRGLPVFALRRGTKEPFRNSRGFKDATTDPQTIRQWWERCPRSNIGIPTGPESGILVLDVDPDKAGKESLERLEQKHSELPATATVRTGGGGLRYLYHYPAGEHIRSRAPAFGEEFPGLDVRAAGGYIVAPPSVTDGLYEPLDRLPVAEPPAWLLEELREPTSAESEPISGVSPGSNRYLSAELDGPEISAGGRNNALTRIAGKLRAGGMEASELADELQRINTARCSPSLPVAEVATIARSAARWKAGTAHREPDPETVSELERIAAGVESDAAAWRGMGGKSRYDVMVALMKTAREHGEKIPAGVRVSIGIRPLMLKAGTSSRDTVSRAIRWLREHGYLRRDDSTRSGTQAGAFVLVSPRAESGHSTLYREAIEPHSELVSRPCAPPTAHPYSAPRLRWSAPEFEGGERVGTIHRLGKTAGRIVDVLEAAGGMLTLEGIASALGISRTRDLRRKDGPLSRLEAAAVVECSANTVSLTADWSRALEDERERAGEIAAYRRDMARYERERCSYRSSRTGFALRESRPESSENPASEPVSEPPELPPEVDPSPTAAEMQAHRESAPRRRREAIEAAMVELFRKHPDYRSRRPGQITCRVALMVGPEFPRGVSPGGPPKDSEIAEILEDNGLEMSA